MNGEKQDRRLTLAVVAVWLCAGVMALGAVLAAAMLAKGGYLLTFGDASPDLDVVDMGLLDAATPAAGLDPVLADVPLANRLLFAVAPLVTAASWLLAAVLVTRVLRDIGAGRPFGAPVVRSLPRAALVLGVGALANLGADVVATLALVASSEMNRLFSAMTSSSFDFPGTTFVCAVVIGALGVAFRRGAAMEHELAGLV